MVGTSGRDEKARGITRVNCTAFCTQGLEKMIDLKGPSCCRLLAIGSLLRACYGRHPSRTELSA